MNHPRPPAPAASEQDAIHHPQLKLVRGLGGWKNAVSAAVVLLLGATAALFLSSASSSEPAAAASLRPWLSSAAGRGRVFFQAPRPDAAQARADLLATVNQPYYQARLRPLALELGPRHPIRAARAPRAAFADVRLSPLALLGGGGGGGGDGGGGGGDGDADKDGAARARGLAVLLAASDGGDPAGVPTDAGAYELFEPPGAASAGSSDNDTQRPQQRRGRRLTCQAAARRLFPEPFHPSMLVRNRAVPTSWAADGQQLAPQSAAAAAAAAAGPPPPPAWRQSQHPHPTRLPAALWRWDAGAIPRAAYDAVPTFLGGQACRMCYDVVRYKLWRGRLYRRSGDCARDLRNASAPPLLPGGTRCGADWPRGRWLEEILLVAAYLYALPDGNLAVHRGDGAAAGFPVLQHNIPRDHPRGGFALPYPGHWVSGGAPSARQAAAWAACARARYGTLASSARRGGARGAAAAAAAEAAQSEGDGPGALAGGSNSSNSSSNSSRPRTSGGGDDGASCARAPLIQKAVWRGATNDAASGAWLHEVLGMARARLHVLSLVHSDALDARVAAVSQMDEPRGFAPMAADRLAAERLLGVPPTPLAGDGWPVAEYGYGKEAVRAAEGRLADCRGQGDDDRGRRVGEEDEEEEEEGGDDGLLREAARGGDEAAGGGSRKNKRAPPPPPPPPREPTPPPPLYMLMEDYNRYSAVLDVDGNGWSSRLWALLLGASARPVLKQATALAGPYEHLFAPGRHIAHFRGNLRDVGDVARRFGRLAAGADEGKEDEGGEQASSASGAGRRRQSRRRQRQRQRQRASCRAPPEEDEPDEDEGLPSDARGADAMAAEAAALAALTLNRWALVESAAAAMEAYAERAAWKPVAPASGEGGEPGWDLVPFSKCCVHGGLPAELVAAMRSAGD